MIQSMCQRGKKKTKRENEKKWKERKPGPISTSTEADALVHSVVCDLGTSGACVDLLRERPTVLAHSQTCPSKDACKRHRVAGLV